jgi:hypothetical protein
MLRIIIAFEMGGGWGHVLPLRAIAREFVHRGCEVVVLCRDVEKARGVFSGMEIALEQSPEWEMRKGGFSLNYAHCVWGNGYWGREMFLSHFRWWTERLRSLRPAFVLTDFAPTALLAALSLDIPRGAVGTGFTLPPQTVPMPSLHPWLALGEEGLSKAEAMLVETINSAVPGVDCVAGIFRGAERFLTIFPETDHFEDRPREKYWGTVFEKATGSVSPWPDGDGQRVFFYLSAENRCLNLLTDHLKRLGLPALGHVRGLPESDRIAMESPTLRLSASLVDLTGVAAECDVAVTQGGYHTTAHMLLSGVRLLLCPEQLEQTLLSYRLNSRGLGVFVSFFSDPRKVTERFDTAASSVDLQRNASDFASRYAGYDSAETVREIIRTCLNASR